MIMQVIPPHLQNAPKRLAYSRASRKRGFTLTELLVVIAIISLLSSLAAVNVKDIGQGIGVHGAAELASSLALSARVEAMSYGYGSLLVIDNGTDPDRKLQRIFVLRYTQTPDSDDYSKYTELVGKPISLPKGTFFLPDYSTATSNTLTLTNLPGHVNNTPVYYYKFDGVGHLDTPKSATLVFSANSIDSLGNLQNPAQMIAGRQGFLLRSNGRAAFFQTAAQMEKRL